MMIVEGLVIYCRRVFFFFSNSPREVFDLISSSIQKDQKYQMLGLPRPNLMNFHRHLNDSSHKFYRRSKSAQFWHNFL